MSVSTPSTRPATRRPKIDSRDYVHDRVQQIVKTEIVPEKTAKSGDLQSWHKKVRAQAFEELLGKLEPDTTFTVRCHLFDRWEATPNGNGQQLIVGCELHFSLEKRK